MKDDSGAQKASAPVEAKKAAPKKAASKKESPKKKVEVKKETIEASAEEASAEEAPKAAPKRGRKSTTKPLALAASKRLAPSRKKPKISENPELAKGEEIESDAVKKLVDMVEAIGTKVFDQDKATTDLSSKLDELTEAVSSISDYLTWAYNQDTDPGNEITALSDVSWV